MPRQYLKAEIRAEKEFKESDHLRDKLGRFAKKAGGKVSEVKEKIIQREVDALDERIEKRLRIPGELAQKYRNLSEKHRAKKQDGMADFLEDLAVGTENSGKKSRQQYMNLLSDPKAKRKIAKNAIKNKVAGVALTTGAQIAAVAIYNKINSDPDLKKKTEEAATKLEESIGIKEKKKPTLTDSIKKMSTSFKEKAEESFKLNAARVSTTLSILQNPSQRGEFAKRLKKAKTPEEMIKAIDDCLTSVDILSKGKVLGEEIQDKREKAMEVLSNLAKKMGGEEESGVDQSVAVGKDVFRSRLRF